MQRKVALWDNPINKPVDKNIPSEVHCYRLHHTLFADTISIYLIRFCIESRQQLVEVDDGCINVRITNWNPQVHNTVIKR